MPISALPPHLQANRFAEGDGTDWDNPLQKFWDRAWVAFGPNAKEDDWGRITILPIPWTKYRIATPFKVPGRWRRFPKVLFAYNLTRWISKNDESVIRLRGLERKLIVWGWMHFKGEGFVRLDSASRRLNVEETNQLGDPWSWISGEDLVAEYGPSPLQQFTDTLSFQFTWPAFVALQLGGRPKTDAPGRFDPRFFIRLLCRWVSGDDMYDVPSFFIGGTSN